MVSQSFFTYLPNENPLKNAMSKKQTQKKQENPSVKTEVTTSETTWFDLSNFKKFPLKYRIGISVLVFLVGFLLYSNTIHHGYVLDDSGVIKDNVNVQKGIKGIPDILKMDLWELSDVKLGYYRPLSLITFAIEIEYFGNAPHVSHFNNVLLFALSGMVLFWVLQLLFGKYNRWIPLLATLLFLAHPIHTEVVANIKSRDEILSFLNLFLVLFFVLKHIESRNWLWLIPTFIFAYLGMLSKETALTGLLLVPIFYYIFSQSSIPQSIVKSIPIILAIFFFFVQKKMALGTLSAVIPNDIVNYPYTTPHVESSFKIATAFYLFAYGVYLMILPLTLRYDYSYNQIPAVDFANPLAIVGLLLFFAGAYFTIKLLWSRKMMGIPLTIFYLSLGPALAFTILRGGIFAERFLYTAVLGFILLLLIGTMELIKKSNLNFINSSPNKPLPILVLVAVAFTLYSFKTIDRNKVWKDNYTLFSTDLKTGQNSAQNLRHFAEQTLVRAIDEKDSLKKIDLAKESLEAFQKSLKLHPKFAESFLKAAVIYQVLLLEPDNAIDYYKKCIKCEPTAPLRAEAYYNLGTVYQNSKADLMYASYCYNQSLAFVKDYPAAISARDALRAAGIDNLLEPLASPVDSNGVKDANFYFKTAYNLASKGDYNKAIDNFNEVLKMNPNNLDALLNVANCYGMLTEYNKSIQINNKIIQLFPNEVRPWKNNAINYEKLGNKAKQTECLERVNAMSR